MRSTVHGFSVGTVFGFPIYIEMTALYLGPWLVFVLLTQASGSDLVRTLVIFAVIPLSVLAHELGHTFTARALGVPVRHIALTWFGGYASFWLQPKRWREALIAAAGPAANLVIGGLLWIASANIPDPNSIDLANSRMTPNGDIVVSFVRSGDLTWLEHAIREGAVVNLALGVFNLLPGLPLDGGHILRTGLSTRMSRGRASWIAAWSGFAIGISAVAYAIWIESFSVLIVGGFVAYSAWLERRRLRYE